MDIRKHGEPIETLDDWFRLAPPKRREKHWQDGRSAKELARFWLAQTDQESDNVLLDLLRPRFGPVTLLSAEPERQVRLDRYRGEQRNCDLKVTAEAAVAGKLCIHIEAKVDERFGDVVGRYDDKKVGTSSKIPERVQDLVRAIKTLTNPSSLVAGTHTGLLGRVVAAALV